MPRKNSQSIKKCCRCEEDYPARRNSHYCLPCADIMWYLRRKVEKRVAHAVRTGKIPAASDLLCEDCLQPAQDYDHRDYGKPLQVAAVCKPCNAKRGPAIGYGEPT